jgi:glycosyltransferase involved in cell wall biosynthesis
LVTSNLISAVIITFNEEANIARCLDSLDGIADEIVVVDSFSRDKTKEICARYGVTFYEHPFECYAKQKNYAISKATYHYILSLDADEALDEELANEIKSEKSKGLTDAYEMKRFTNFCGKWIKHCGWYPDRKVRLFHRQKARWIGEKVHETLDVDKGTDIKKLSGDILHYSFSTTDEHMATVNKYESLKAEKQFEAGKSASTVKTIFSPLFTFIRIYILKQGFRDGWYGFVISVNSAHGSFLKQIKLRQLQEHSAKN